MAKKPAAPAPKAAAAAPATPKTGPKIRSVSRALVKAMRRERKKHPTAQDMIRRSAREDYDARKTREAAEALHAQYSAAGATWAACVQAVKTNQVDRLKDRFAEKAASAA